MRFGSNTLGKWFQLALGNEDLEGTRHVTQSGGEVHRRADVVVALEQQGQTRRQTYTQRQRRAGRGRPALQLQRERDGIGLFDGHDHAPVTQPFRDAHAAFGGDFTCHGAERPQESTCGIVTGDGRVVRETRQVHECEGTGDTHHAKTTTRRVLRGSRMLELG